jgi:DNA polymerase/3'-5' exonuclease PolX
MDNKTLIIEKLEKLKNTYVNNENKKWNLRALSNAINSLKKYNGIIISGKQIENEIKGIGTKISKRIDEILETGDLIELNNIDNNIDNIDNINNIDDNNINNSLIYYNNIIAITGVGNVRAKKWIEMGIKNIDDVIEYKKNNKIQTTHHIDIGIKYYYDLQQKIPRIEIDKIKIYIKEALNKIDKNLIFNICGSYRRNCIESGDIDILISNKNLDNIIDNYLEHIVSYLKKNDFIIDSLTNKGNTKFMGICKLKDYSIARRIDIRVIDYKSYYSSLLYFTGNKNFNLFIRNKALENNYSLNEYGLTDIRDNTNIYICSEKDIFKILKIDYLTPEERNKF